MLVSLIFKHMLDSDLGTDPPPEIDEAELVEGSSSSNEIICLLLALRLPIGRLFANGGGTAITGSTRISVGLELTLTSALSIVIANRIDPSP